MLPSVRERQAALEKRFPVWEPRRLDQMLDAAVEEFPDRPYVITDERTWTYQEIQQWSIRIAHGLVDSGVRPGEHVAMVMANFPEFVAVKYGIARAGATCVPVNYLNRRDELGYVLGQSDAVTLITMDRFRDLDYLAALDELAPGWEHEGGGERLPRLRTVVVFSTTVDGGRPGTHTLDELAATSDEWAPVAGASASATADVLYTSGTTGQPKGVLLTHAMLLRTAYSSAFSRAFQDGHRVTFSLPMYHVFGYVEGMLSVLFAGGAIIPRLAFDPEDTLRAIARHRASDVLFIPTMAMAVVDEADAARAKGDSYDISSLTSMLCSGGVAPAGLWDRLDEMFVAVEITTGYGMSETTATAALTRPDDPPDRRRTTHGRMRNAGVAGDAALGGLLVDYRVVDRKTRTEVPTGEVGELLARGPGVTAGYYRKPDETDAAFTDGAGWLRTGDLARIDSDRYVTLAGRVKETYRCGGEQVMPREVEDVLAGHPKVAQAHVVPLSDDRMGEVGVAWVVSRDGAEPDADELRSYCADRLARFKVPKHILPIAEADIPTTPTGRPRKFLLAQRAAERLLEDR
jgi:fatty-acyl-CoA synthase